MPEYDFSGWATKNDLRCSDGRTIRKNAFKDNDGKTVPLVWMHQHNEPENVLGHALLENRETGVYTYCSFNDTPNAKTAKMLVQHGDICGLSIYANQLKQDGGDVLHGSIREVSLVLATANPGAFIDCVLAHGDDSEIEEAVIYTGEEISLSHADKEEGGKETMAEEKPEVKVEEKPEVKAEEKSEKEETLKDVFDTLNEKQKKVVYAMIGIALQEQVNKTEDNEGGNENMKHSVFDEETEKKDVNVISHSDMEAVIADAKRYGSMKESALQHGIEDIEYLFPEAKTVSNTPDWVTRDQEWVGVVMNGVRHTPFSRVKSQYANITADDARAKGYIKGNMKTEEFFAVAKRTTTPTTIYKKQKLDRDDVMDITDFDVVAWIKGEMRLMLNEEIARAILIGDGRVDGTDDKISETNIRPIWKDNDIYSVKKTVTFAGGATDNEKAKAVIKAIIKSRKDYKGSGNPVLFTTEDWLTDMLLMEDTQGRVIYETKEKLATALRVKDIVAVPVMENQSRTSGADTLNLMGIMVNLADYNIGPDKGGAVSMFEDFDIDYNAQKYLIETRCSGALVKPYSAIVIETK